MFEKKLNERFARLQAELGQVLYRRYGLKRQLVRLEEDVTRMEAGLAELSQVKRDVEAQEAIDRAQAKAEADDAIAEKSRKHKKK